MVNDRYIPITKKEISFFSQVVDYIEERVRGLYLLGADICFVVSPRLCVLRQVAGRFCLDQRASQLTTDSKQMATRNLTRKYVDIRNAQRANKVTGFHSNVIRVNGEDEGSLLETVRKI